MSDEKRLDDDVAEFALFAGWNAIEAQPARFCLVVDATTVTREQLLGSGLTEHAAGVLLDFSERLRKKVAERSGAEGSVTSTEGER